jgi:hypothetical protein
MGLLALKTGPAEVNESIRINAELTNMPSIGMNGNTAFSEAQLNLAPVRPAGSSKCVLISGGPLTLIFIYLTRRHSSRRNGDFW